MTKGRKEKATPKKTKSLTKTQIQKQVANKQSLVPNALNPKQVLFVLQNTPAKHIYKRPAKGGGEWEYVTGAYVRKVLNYAFGWMWDFNIVDKGREGDQVWVQGRLTVKNKKGEAMIVKEQFGRADVKFKRGTKNPLDYGNDLKSASTDALKKCSADLGIASDIYGKMEMQNIQNKTAEDSKTRNQPAEPEAVHDCHECGNNITEAEKKFSLKLYKKQFCRGCQEEAKKGNIKI